MKEQGCRGAEVQETMDKPVPPPTEPTIDDELALLLREIEKEAVPDRLMELALQLQEALATRREAVERDGSSAADAPVSVLEEAQQKRD
jgi:hypothetical protein